MAATTAAQVRGCTPAWSARTARCWSSSATCRPARVLDQAGPRAGRLDGHGRPVRRCRRYRRLPRGALLVIDRPGSVQSSLRMGGAAVTREDPRYPALQLANLIFGGYFSSRWTENIREDKGYTYGPHSRIDHHLLGSSLSLDVEVATEVTAPAILETRYELGRIATLPVTKAEVDAVRQYAIGTLALSTATQAGLASTLSALAAFGLGLDWVLEHPAGCARPRWRTSALPRPSSWPRRGLTSVIVGDAATISGPLAALGGIES